MARRTLLAAALVVVALPGNGHGWFGLGNTRDHAVAATATRVDPAAPPRDHSAELAPTTTWSAPPTTSTTSAPAPTAIPAAEPDPAPSDPPPSPSPPAPSAPSPAAAPASAPTPAVSAEDAAPPAVVARIHAPAATLYAAPGAARPIGGIDAKTEFGTPRVVLTTELRGDWLQVLLPTRPNGSTGWVRASDVELSTVDDRIVVDLAARTVTWEHGGTLVGVVPAAVGAPSSPTPTGTFYVTDVLAASSLAGGSTGQYGAWVVALNAHSDTFTTFGSGGDARIAIHGTNQPGSIGAAVSSGCVRIGAAPLDTLARNIPLGTPVIIR